MDSVGGDFVSLTWDKPRSDGGGKIKGYYIEKKDKNSDMWVRVNHQPTPACIFNCANLIEDREYEFRVFAVNEAGESKPSEGTRPIKVRDPDAATMPVFNQGLMPMSAVQGRTAKFEVDVSGNPSPKISW